MEKQSTPKKGMRRLYIGCLGFVIFLAVAFVALVLIVRQIIHSYTDTAATPLPIAEMPRAEREKLNDRYKEFERAVDSGTRGVQFKVTGPEVNVLISDIPDLRGKLQVFIEEGRISGKASIPLDKTGIPFTKGRFLNGVCVLQPSMQNGVLVVTAQSIVVNNKQLPGFVMSRIRDINLAERANQDPGALRAISRFGSFDLHDDVAVVHGKEPAQ